MNSDNNHPVLAARACSASPFSNCQSSAQQLKLFSFLSIVVQMQRCFVVLLICACCAVNATFDGRLRKTDELRSDALLSAVFPSSHAPFLFETRKGTLMIAHFSGQFEGASRCAIVVSTFNRALRHWRTPVVASVQTGASHQNPVLFQTADSGDRVSLLHTQQNAGPLGVSQSSSRVLLLHSDDEGLTWSPPLEVFARGTGTFLRAPPLAIGGQLLLPLYFTPSGEFDLAAQHSAIWVAKNSQTAIQSGWRQRARIPGTENAVGVQPAVVRFRSGRLVAFMRNRSGRGAKIMRSASHNDGHSWTQAEPTDLDSNNSGIAAVVLHNDTLVLAFNDDSDGNRFPLSLAFSDDFGITFHSRRAIVDEHVAGGGRVSLADRETIVNGEHSYPSLLVDGDGNSLHIAWTHLRRTIAYAQMRL
jgi:predicted neuraminidase